MTLLRALRHRPFALLWGGQTVSRFGDAIHGIALAWLVLELTGSAAAMGLVLAAHLLPFLVFSLAGGIAVDRLPRLRIMLTADLIRMAIVAGLAGLIVADALAIWHLGVLVAIFGAVEAFFYPAYTAVVPELVPADDRPSANGLYQIGRRLSRIVGPGVGALLVAGGGTAAAFAMDALSFAISAVLIVLASRAGRIQDLAVGNPLAPDPPSVQESDFERPVSASETPPLPPPRTSALQDLREGLRTVTEAPWIWIAIVLAGVTGITLAGPLEAALPLLVSEHLGAGVGVLGLLESMIAIGGIAAAIVLGSRPRLRRRGPIMYGAWITFALAVAICGLPVGIPGVAIAGVLCGACGAIVGLVWTNTLQDLVPPDRLGRVSSIDAMGSTALEPIGYVTAGSAADLVGPAAVFLWGGLISAGLLALPLLHPSVRDLD